MVKIVKHHGLVWFVWFDLGLRALNFITVTQSVTDQYSYQGGHRAARAAKKRLIPEIRTAMRFFGDFLQKKGGGLAKSKISLAEKSEIFWIFSLAEKSGAFKLRLGGGGVRGSQNFG